MKRLILAFLPLAAFAQTKIPEVTIYGSSHVPVELPKVGASVSLITAEEIEARGIKLLSEALQSLPGIRANNNSGGLSQVRMRGGEGKHTLIIVDGIVYNDVNQGEAYLDDFPTNDIERIEVIRGPQSGVYGAQAHAGAIVITTKSGKGFRKPEVNASIEYGSLGSPRVTFSAQGQVGKVYSATSIQANRTDGYNIARHGNEKDSSGNYNVTQKLGIDLTEHFNIEAFIRHQNKTQKFDNGFGGFGGPEPFLIVEDADRFLTTKTTLAGLRMTYKALEGRWVHTLSGDMNDQSSKAYSNGLDNYSNDAQRYNFQYKNAFRFAFAGMKHTLVTGFDTRRENYKYQDTGNDEWKAGSKRDKNGIFGEYLVDFNQGTAVTAALRQDYNSVFANMLTYRLTAAHSFATGTKLHSSYGKGSTNPTFQQQYGYQPINFIGNPNIKPEQSHGFDFGVEQKWLGGKLVTDLTYFNTIMSDAIINAWQDVFPFKEFVVNSPNKLRREGLEFAFTALPTDKLSVSGSYTYFTGKDETGQLPRRRPNHAGSLHASYRFLEDKALLTIGATHNGKMRDSVTTNPGFATDYVMLNSFTLLNAQLSYDINKSTTAYIRAENMLNAKYEEVYSYRGKPVEVFAGLKVKLQ